MSVGRRDETRRTDIAGFGSEAAALDWCSTSGTVRPHQAHHQCGRVLVHRLQIQAFAVSCTALYAELWVKARMSPARTFGSY